MNFQRRQNIISELAPKRVLVVYGPRRIGKTTALNEYLAGLASEKPIPSSLYATGDDLMLHEIFREQRRATILEFAANYDVIAIDEAQNIPNIGMGAKMIIDAYPEKRLILTGSSSFDLSHQVGEPLTGRHFTMTMLPLAQMEMKAGRFELKQALPDFLIYGSYPEVLMTDDKREKQRILKELVSSYLFKDVLALDRIKSPKLLLDIVRCLAFQVGSEVSLNEIGRTVMTDHKTVSRYVDLLEKMFVIVHVSGYRRNLRTEIGKKAKYYFVDNGVRNAVIASFNGLEKRDDVGALWENFIFMEMMKRNLILNRYENFFFWRTHAGQEIDIVRERDGGLLATECKWSEQFVSPPNAWQAAYPKANFEVIHRENYLDFLLAK